MAETSNDFDVICVGGGFSGLTAAYTLLKAKPSIKLCVLEAKDRVGGRTCLQKLNCAKADGSDDVHEWEFGGMWVGRKQLDIMELLKELNIGTYDQYITGTKCIRLDSDDKTRKYESNLPSVGVLSTVDLGQAMARIERLIKSVDAADPWKHPEAAYLDSISVAELFNKYSWTARVKDMVLAAMRTVYGTDSAHVSALYFLAYCSAAGSLQELLEATPETAQEYKIKGGSQNVCKKLVEDFIGSENLKLSTPVTRIEQSEESLVVYAGKGGMKYITKYVIIALPTHQIMNIDFSPALPYSKKKIYQFMPVGHLIKVIITYRKAYWRIQGYSGELVTTDPRKDGAGAVSIAYDATSEHGHPALVTFIGGDQATIWGDKSDEDRRSSVLKSLSEHFSIPELLEPIDYQEKDWGKETFNGGCPVNIVSPGGMKFYKELKSSVGRLAFAGTESSEVCCGFISGAVNAGKRAAHEVLKKLNKEQQNQEA